MLASLAITIRVNAKPGIRSLRRFGRQVRWIAFKVWCGRLWRRVKSLLAGRLRA